MNVLSILFTDDAYFLYISLTAFSAILILVMSVIVSTNAYSIMITVIIIIIIISVVTNIIIFYSIKIFIKFVFCLQIF